MGGGVFLTSDRVLSTSPWYASACWLVEFVANFTFDAFCIFASEQIGIEALVRGKRQFRVVPIQPTEGPFLAVERMAYSDCALI